eukprot:817214-Rhodomonas_salina.5
MCCVLVGAWLCGLHVSKGIAHCAHRCFVREYRAFGHVPGSPAGPTPAARCSPGAPVVPPYPTR